MKYYCHLGLAVTVLVALVRAVPIQSDEIQAKVAQGFRLLSLSDDSDPVWKTESQVLDLLRHNIRFIDVTETHEIEQELNKMRSKVKVMAGPYGPPSHQDVLKPIIQNISVDNLKADLTQLSSFNNRYYKSPTGVNASAWIRSTLKEIAAGREGVTISEFKHSWGQSSTIARIEGKVAKSPVTILGAHMDSINLNNPMNGRAPGADDDGSGSVNVIEAFRVLLNSGFQPSTPVEFHWYSGEEAGLLGSNAIATSYAKSKVQVKAYMQLDMTAYFEPGSKESVTLMTDNTDSNLNEFMKQLITTYTRLPWATDRCGYACSDHASWNRNGYPATMPFEASMSDSHPSIHSPQDSISFPGFSWDHSLEFTKLSVAYVYELSI